MPSRALSVFKRGSYFDVSRAPRYSVLFALPLLLAYEALAAVLAGPRSSQVRNGADVLLKEAFIAVAGRNGPLIFISAVIGIGIWFIARDIRKSKQGVRPLIFGGMLAESIALAAAFGFVIGTITVKLLGSLHVLSMMNAPGEGTIAQMNWMTRLMLSLGAGLYEELLFRVLLVSGLAAGARAAFGWGVRGSGIFATLVGALIFSAFHYIGPFADPFRLTSFTFRAISGVAFSALYLTRGFGITAWTHSLYDAFLLLG
jgi:hypothetical protein